MIPALTIAGAELRLEQVSKQYAANAPAAVESVDLTIQAGEFLTLLGPSGSGKTTLLNIIAGFVEQTEGKVLIDGSDVAMLPPHRRNLGFVFQNYALFPHMSVFDNIAYPLRRRRVVSEEVRRRVDEIVEIVQLGQLKNRQPKELSGGQQQRVALARALVFRPRALLLDEPLAALDRELRESLQDELRRLHRGLGITVILVTHDQQEALHLSDRIAVLDRGSIQQVGTPSELYEKPQTAFVARFLGDSTFLQGVVSNDGLLVGGDSYPIPEGKSQSSQRGPGVLVIRPDCVLLGVDAHSRDVYRAGIVSDLVYRGSSIRVSIETASGTTILASLPSREIGAVRVGDVIDFGWNVSDSSLILDSGSELHAVGGGKAT